MVKDHSDRREETRCRHIGYSFRLATRVLLYASSQRQDNTYYSLCYSRGALAGTRNSSMGPAHEGSIRRPIAPWANTLTTELHLAQHIYNSASLETNIFGVPDAMSCTQFVPDITEIVTNMYRTVTLTGRLFQRLQCVCKSK